MVFVDLSKEGIPGMNIIPESEYNSIKNCGNDTSEKV